jgi:hypothetical protein
MHKPSNYLVVTYFLTYLPITYEAYFLQNWLPRWNQILTWLRFIDNWLMTGIQWMVCWWVLVHCGPDWALIGHIQYVGLQPTGGAFPKCWARLHYNLPRLLFFGNAESVRCYLNLNLQLTHLDSQWTDDTSHVPQSKTMGSALHYKSALLRSGLYCDVVSAIDLLTCEASSLSSSVKAQFIMFSSVLGNLSIAIVLRLWSANQYCVFWKS